MGRLKVRKLSSNSSTSLCRLIISDSSEVLVSVKLARKPPIMASTEVF